MPRSKTIVKNIYLVGLSGSGKSTVGPILAEKLGARFFDSDSLVEKREGKRIGEIFKDSGERSFRKAESLVIEELSARKGKKVVALGGGAFQFMRNRNIVNADGLTVYLSCSVRLLARRLRDLGDRPLLAGLALGSKPRIVDLEKRLKDMLTKRSENYKKADITVSTSADSPRIIANNIIATIKKLNGDS